MSEKIDETDPFLRIMRSRMEGAKRDAEMLAEIAEKKLAADKRIINSRIAKNAEIQKKRLDYWPK